LILARDEFSRVVELLAQFSIKMESSINKISNEIKSIKKGQTKFVSHLEKLSSDLKNLESTVGSASQVQEAIDNQTRLLTLVENLKAGPVRGRPPSKEVKEVKEFDIEKGAEVGGDQVAGDDKPTEKKPNLKDMKSYLHRSKTIFDVKILNCFITSAVSVIESNIRIKPSFIKLEMHVTEYIPPYIAGRMSLKGTTGGGELAVSFPRNTILFIVCKMFKFKSVKEATPDLVEDVTKELCNQICGQAKIELVKLNYDMHIEIPQISKPSEEETEIIPPQISLQFQCRDKYPFTIDLWN